MPLTGEYERSKWDWVQDQIDTYERTDGREANTLWDTGLPIIIMTTVGVRSGKLRKVALMKVSHAGEYAIVASKGGDPKHPGWYHNLVAAPTSVTIQDGPEPWDAVVRELEGAERDRWWDLAVRAYPPYAEYQERTDRLIPLLVARPSTSTPSQVGGT
jgi:deazaflavin-dependent oxidoreductase (nitroreductase family)